MEITYSNGSLKPEEIIKFLAFTGELEQITKEIIKNREVRKKAEEMGIDVSDEKLQEFADFFRREIRLYSVEETLSFFKKYALSEEDFEEFCESTVLVEKVKYALATDEKINEYFVNNRTEFDMARIYSIVVENKNLAQEILMQITEDEADFHKLARTYSIDESTKYAGGYRGIVTRNIFTPEVSAKIFNASKGEVIGPFERDGKFEIILVDEVMKAEMNEGIKHMIKEKIFREWLHQIVRDGIKIHS